jgi:hypothetical protein
MENKIELAIREAKKYLEHPRDATHDLGHHEAVWKNCKDIISKEKLNVNSGLLKVATFWHDVVLEKEGKVSSDNVKEVVEYLKTFLPGLGFDNSETKIILDTVLHHEFRDTPVGVEGMVLQDADKLEVLSKDRWERTLDAYESGKMSKEKYVSYLKTGLLWFSILESTFHYRYSKRIVHESISSIFDDSKMVDAIKRVGLQKELDDSKKSMNSLRTKIIRVLINLNNFKINLLINFRKMSK